MANDIASYVPVTLQDLYDAARLFVMHYSVPSTHGPITEKWADLSGYTVHSNLKWVPGRPELKAVCIRDQFDSLQLYCTMNKTSPGAYVKFRYRF